MKYIFYICIILLGILCMGCQKNTIKEQLTISTGNVDTPISIVSGREQNLQGNFSSPITINGIYHPIIISGDILMYVGNFTITIPKNITTWEYVNHNDILTQTYTEWMGFTSDDKKTSFTFHIRKIVRPDSKVSHQELCRKKYMEGLLSESHYTKIIQNKIIYVSYVRLKVSALDIQPYTLQEMQICFVDNDMIYNFSLSNYTHSYMNSILESLHFN